MKPVFGPEGTSKPAESPGQSPYSSGYPRKIGLLGGSFNPAHGGHRSISLFAQQALGLDEVWWLVSPGNPLKPAKTMAPMVARIARAQHIARRTPIRPTAIEAQIGTRYSYDTLRAIKHRYPNHRFIWLMGADNLRQFGQWKNAHGIARTMPIAVIARPGYDDRIHGEPIMSWLRPFVRPASQSKNWTEWRVPALVQLRFRPDTRSATALRSADPLWHRAYQSPAMRDRVTHRPIHSESPHIPFEKE